MNYNLQKEIIKHIFDIMNIFPSKDMFKTTLLENLLDKKYIIDKKLAFEDDSKKEHKSNIWATTSKIDDLEFKIMIADLTENNVPEFCILTQVDKTPPCGIVYSLDQNDNGTMMFSVDEAKWLPANVLQLSKCLTGWERLAAIYAKWNRLDKYEDLYKYLVGFLNFIENNENQ